MKHQPSTNGHIPRIQEILGSKTDLEERLNALRIYKRDQDHRLQEDFFFKRTDLSHLMGDLTDLADAILEATLEIARTELTPAYGLPSFKDNDGNFLPSGFALIGMGKLGGRELHFGSDLDLIFVFDRNGETHGPRKLTNREYFACLTQRIISYLTLHTRHGYLYKVDTELRPSGNAGALVTNLETWIAYYHEQAALWEKQALLKARLIRADPPIDKAFGGLFRRLIFLAPFPENFSQEIHRLRLRMERELAKEGDRRWNYKKGYGGLVDIEFALQFLQLKLGKVYDSILTPNTLQALERLSQTHMLPPEERETLWKGYCFYRELEIYLEVKFKLKDGYLDPFHECIPELAQYLSFPGAEDFLKYFRELREDIRRIYLKVLHV